jgi:hypothetical protein
MEFKGTKGRLEVIDNTFKDENRGYCGVFDIVNEQGQKFAQVAPYEFFQLTLEQAHANAILTSKAPEMLEMLKRLTSLINDIDQTLFQHNHKIEGWHLNGDLEPIMNFVALLDMNSVSEAKNLIKSATEL